MKIFTDKRLLRAGLIGGTLSRHSGNMRELANQQTVYKELGVPPERMLHLHQVHGNHILSISSQESAQQCADHCLQDADAWLGVPLPSGWGVSIVTADCVPLFLWEDSGTCAALAHCGWRGVAQGLPGKIAQELARKNPHTPLNAWLGPHIQACCFEVQQDVADQFPAACVIHKNGKIFIDLNTEIKRQLLQEGLTEKTIHTPDYCTCTDPENFFSWRRDHEKNLLLSFIYKP